MQASGAQKAKLLCCGKPCHKALPNCTHVCQQTCHQGPCPGAAGQGCQEEVTVRCSCRHHKAKMPCHQVHLRASHCQAAVAVVINAFSAIHICTNLVCFTLSMFMTCGQERNFCNLMHWAGLAQHCCSAQASARLGNSVTCLQKCQKHLEAGLEHRADPSPAEQCKTVSKRQQEMMSANA